MLLLGMIDGVHLFSIQKKWGLARGYLHSFYGCEKLRLINLWYRYSSKESSSSFRQFKELR